MLVENFTNPYDNFEAEIYDAVVAPAVKNYFFEHLKMFIDKIPRNAQVLDIGCGGGQNANALLSLRNDIFLTGIDLSKLMTEKSLERNIKYKSNTKFIQANVEKMPFDDEMFDVVYSIASIKHWKHKSLALDEVYRVLKPKGLLFIVEVDRGCKLDDAQSFVEQFRLPAFSKYITLPLFYTYVAGQSINIDEAEKLMQDSQFKGYEINKIEKTPALQIIGYK